MSSQRPDISIVIKALNEERHIAAAIESALEALIGVSGEVILADSASTDRTIEIAAKYPIKIVSLCRIEDRSCGAGVQLAYQYSAGRYICLIDGDMRLRRDFVFAAVRFLQEHHEFAGVGGMIIERETTNFEYVKRAKAQDPDRLPGEVSRLDCGGLYRRQAIEAVGYLGDRNLHAIEELELGVRLRAKGWKLARIDMPAIDHYGHAGSAYSVLLQRWATGYAFGTGEILRAAFGRACFWLTLRNLRWQLFLLAAMHVWWLALIAAPIVIEAALSAAIAVIALGLLPFVVMAVRCRSIRLGIYSVAAWNVYAAGIWPGLLHRRTDPAGWIESIVVRDPISPDIGVAATANASEDRLNNLVTSFGANGL